MRAFAIDVLGLRVAGQDGEDFVELATADGSKLELFGSHEAADGPWLFESNPVVAGFLVDDIQAAREELTRAGVELLRQAFPTGVCDYSRPGVGVRSPIASWLSYGDNSDRVVGPFPLPPPTDPLSR